VATWTHPNASSDKPAAPFVSISAQRVKPNHMTTEMDVPIVFGTTQRPQLFFSMARNFRRTPPRFLPLYPFPHPHQDTPPSLRTVVWFVVCLWRSKIFLAAAAQLQAVHTVCKPQSSRRCHRAHHQPHIPRLALTARYSCMGTFSFPFGL
jgi:hypothetical protein